MNKYKLINNYDPNDTIVLEVEKGEDPYAVALDQLGWILVESVENED